MWRLSEYLVLALLAIVFAEGVLALVRAVREEIPRGVLRWRKGVGWSWRRPAPLPRFLAVFGLTVALAACSTVQGVTPAQQAVLTAEQDFTAAEQAFDAVVQLADAAIDTGAVPAATVTQIKGLVDAGYADVKIGRTAVAAGTATSITAETTALGQLVAEITNLLPKPASAAAAK